MSDDKKYYYLKLKDNFFDTDEMIVLESMADGHLYSNILLKLYLRSLKNEGKLMFNERIPYNSTILSQVVRHPVGVIEKAISVFKELGLIEVLDNGAIYMLDIQNFIGQSSTEADRQREYQHRISQEKKLLSEPICKKSNKKSNRKSTPEIEIEKEIDKELEIEKKKSKKVSSYEAIINDYTSNTDLKNTILEFIKMRTMIKAKLTDNALSLMLSKLDKLGKNDNEKMQILQQSIMSSWKGIFPLKAATEPKQQFVKKDNFNNYEQRPYDGSNGGMTFDELEKGLLGWQNN